MLETLAEDIGSKCNLSVKSESVANHHRDRDVARIWKKYLKVSWKFLTLKRHTDILDNDAIEEN